MRLDIYPPEKDAIYAITVRNVLKKHRFRTTIALFYGKSINFASSSEDVDQNTIMICRRE